MITKPVKIAVPLQGERVSGHFGHPDCFCLVTVDPDAQKVLGQKFVTPPPHEPGRLPLWLAGHRVNVVLAGGIGQHAVALLESKGIDVHAGVPPFSAHEVVRLWLSGDLQTADNACNHEDADHECRHG